MVLTMNGKMIHHLKGLLLDLGVVTTWLSLILMQLDPQLITALGAIGAVIVGRLLDWCREEYKEKKKKQRSQRFQRRNSFPKFPK